MPPFQAENGSFQLVLVFLRQTLSVSPHHSPSCGKSLHPVHMGMHRKIESTLSPSRSDPRECPTVGLTWPAQTPSAAPYSTSTSCSSGEGHIVGTRLLTKLAIITEKPKEDLSSVTLCGCGAY